ncbi:MAG: hypothetical protein HY302_09270 [Opitutae bacterium]|nr:hypothetical protein [Opitutae bacterium]
MNTPAKKQTTGPRTIRSDFRCCLITHSCIMEALHWRLAWTLAVIYRCPKRYRAFVRRKMREAAVAAVCLARHEAARRMASSLAA